MNDYNEQIIRRGEIYYIRKGKPVEGSEQEADTWTEESDFRQEQEAVG